MFETFTQDKSTPLYKIGKVLGKIFHLYEKLGIKQEEPLFKYKQTCGFYRSQKIERTLKSINDMKMEDETLILAFLFVDKVTSKLGIFLTRENSNAIIVGCLILADKVLQDQSRSLREFSIVSGLTVEELNSLELLSALCLRGCISSVPKEVFIYLKLRPLIIQMIKPTLINLLLKMST